MMPIYTSTEFDNCKSRESLPLKCEYCGGTFYKTKHNIQILLNPHKRGNCNFCSKECSDKNKINKHEVVCKQCNKKFLKLPSQIKKSKNNFCSKSCSCTYNNTHKTKGTRRSKLEI
jgi:hypothetical protein